MSVDTIDDWSKMIIIIVQQKGKQKKTFLEALASLGPGLSLTHSLVTKVNLVTKVKRDTVVFEIT